MWDIWILLDHERERERENEIYLERVPSVVYLYWLCLGLLGSPGNLISYS